VSFLFIRKQNIIFKSDAEHRKGEITSVVTFALILTYALIHTYIHIHTYNYQHN